VCLDLLLLLGGLLLGELLRVEVRRVLGGLLEASEVERREVLGSLDDALLERNLGFPAQVLARLGDIGLALLGVIAGQRHVDDLGRRLGGLDCQLGELLDGELARVAHVDGADGLGLVHQPDEAVDEVVDVAEGARLLPLAVDGDVLAVERLHEEIGDHATVVGVHARAVGVEDAHDPDVHPVLPVVVEAEGLGGALALVVARAHAVAVHVAPVLLGLRRDVRVAVDLRRRCLQYPGLDALGEAEHVHRADDRRLHRLHRVVLVVHRRRRARHVVDLVDLDEKLLGHVVADDLKVGLVKQVLDVGLLRGEEVVERDDVVALVDEAAAQVRSEEAAAARHQDAEEGCSISICTVFKITYLYFTVFNILSGYLKPN